VIYTAHTVHTVWAFSIFELHQQDSHAFMVHVALR
jgi:hypothetical protein